MLTHCHMKQDNMSEFFDLALFSPGKIVTDFILTNGSKKILCKCHLEQNEAVSYRNPCCQWGLWDWFLTQFKAEAALQIFWRVSLSVSLFFITLKADYTKSSASVISPFWWFKINGCDNSLQCKSRQEILESSVPSINPHMAAFLM